MNAKTIIFLMTILLVGSVNMGCKKKFQEINENPNNLVDATPDLLLTNVLTSISSSNSKLGFQTSAAIMQMYALRDFNIIDRYEMGSNAEQWSTCYRAIRDLNQIIEKAKGDEGKQYEGVAMIMKAYVGALLTDLYGNVPFYEAGQGLDGIFYPIYDTQESIYIGTGGILDLLKKGIASLNSSSGNIGGDIMFYGDKAAWVRFGNSLRLRYLLRISDKYSNAGTEMQAIVSEGNYITSNSENALVAYLSQPNHWYLHTERDSDFKAFKLNAFAKDLLFDQLQDNRIDFFFDVNSEGNYYGLVSGNQSTASEAALLSNMDENMRAADVMYALFIHAAEVQFILAEGVQKGLISGNVNTHYDNGVTMSFEYLGVAMPVDYLTNSTKGMFDAVSPIESIITQKWISNFFLGYEAWFDYRRTGFPAFTPAQNNVNGDVIPVRFQYPSSELFTNQDNYNTAVSQMGGANDYNAKGWWEE